MKKLIAMVCVLFILTASLVGCGSDTKPKAPAGGGAGTGAGS